jgi:hypothetical protein
VQTLGSSSTLSTADASAEFEGIVLLNPGDHICSIYSTGDELAGTVGAFLAEGLPKSEPCWVPRGGEHVVGA